MTDKQQITQMASDMYYAPVDHDLWPGDAKEIAKALYILNYRQIPKDAVVLTMEEYNALLREQNRLNKVVKYFQELIEDGKLVSSTQTRKELEKEIFTKLIEVAKNNDNKISIGLLKAWAIEYDVEVK